ncbi:MAG: hypothetical protein HY586_05585, partial [Candidatus Omnitrophica bacterium]|nr:hypothetical protein [Candidatus Omnitrophota bacterium]
RVNGELTQYAPDASTAPLPVYAMEADEITGLVFRDGCYYDSGFGNFVSADANYPASGDTSKIPFPVLTGIQVANLTGTSASISFQSQINSPQVYIMKSYTPERGNFDTYVGSYTAYVRYRPKGSETFQSAVLPNRNASMTSGTFELRGLLPDTEYEYDLGIIIQPEPSRNLPNEYYYSHRHSFQTFSRVSTFQLVEPQLAYPSGDFSDVAFNLYYDSEERSDTYDYVRDHWPKISPGWTAEPYHLEFPWPQTVVTIDGVSYPVAAYPGLRLRDRKSSRLIDLVLTKVVEFGTYTFTYEATIGTEKYTVQVGSRPSSPFGLSVENNGQPEWSANFSSDGELTSLGDRRDPNNPHEVAFLPSSGVGVVRDPSRSDHSFVGLIRDDYYPTGSSIQLEYEPSYGRLARVTGSDGRALEYSYNGDGDLSSIRDVRTGKEELFFYDTERRLIRKIDFTGKIVFDHRYSPRVLSPPSSGGNGYPGELPYGYTHARQTGESLSFDEAKNLYWEIKQTGPIPLHIDQLAAWYVDNGIMPAFGNPTEVIRMFTEGDPYYVSPAGRSVTGESVEQINIWRREYINAASQQMGDNSPQPVEDGDDVDSGIIFTPDPVESQISGNLVASLNIAQLFIVPEVPGYFPYRPESEPLDLSGLIHQMGNAGFALMIGAGVAILFVTGAGEVGSVAMGIFALGSALVTAEIVSDCAVGLRKVLEGTATDEDIDNSGFACAGVIFIPVGGQIVSRIRAASKSVPLAAKAITEITESRVSYTTAEKFLAGNLSTAESVVMMNEIVKEVTTFSKITVDGLRLLINRYGSTFLDVLLQFGDDTVRAIDVIEKMAASRPDYFAKGSSVLKRLSESGIDDAEKLMKWAADTHPEDMPTLIDALDTALGFAKEGGAVSYRVVNGVPQIRMSISRNLPLAQQQKLQLLSGNPAAIQGAVRGVAEAIIRYPKALQELEAAVRGYGVVVEYDYLGAGTNIKSLRRLLEGMAKKGKAASEIFDKLRFRVREIIPGELSRLFADIDQGFAFQKFRGVLEKSISKPNGYRAAGKIDSSFLGQFSLEIQFTKVNQELWANWQHVAYEGLLSDLEKPIFDVYAKAISDYIEAGLPTSFFPKLPPELPFYLEFPYEGLVEMNPAATLLDMEEALRKGRIMFSELALFRRILGERVNVLVRNRYDFAMAGNRRFIVTQQLTDYVSQIQGTSPKVGDFVGIRGLD